jgi:hypothetical protein
LKGCSQWGQRGAPQRQLQRRAAQVGSAAAPANNKVSSNLKAWAEQAPLLDKRTDELRGFGAPHKSATPAHRIVLEGSAVDGRKLALDCSLCSCCWANPQR